MEPGSRLGPYEIVDRLGAGGMGEVYRARDVRLGRTVAVKVLRPGSSPELLHRLDREARAASSLNHPNIVQIFDVGQDAGDDAIHYVVMEHVEGETLRRHLNRETPTIPRVIEWGVQLAEGLARAHGAGIIHRDLKPENVMVTRDGTLKILDFGLAKVSSSLADLDQRATLSRHTQAGVLLGTLEYMAPEQATGRDVDPRADQFALGAILYEMTTGQSPFHRPTAAESLAAVLERQPEPVARLRPDVPPVLEEVIRRCLSKDRAGRYADATLVAQELRGATTRPSPPPPLPAVVVPAKVVVPDRPSRWSVQSDSQKIRTFEETKLVEAIRRGRLSGLEMARREGEEDWTPLYETRVYAREVPVGRDPLRAARMRSLRDVGGHLSGFLITAGIMFVVEGGRFPFWLGIWGVVLLMHLLKAVPTALALLSAERAALAPPAAIAHVALPERPLPPLEAEAARVRTLIEKRGGDDAARLLKDVEGIVAATAEVSARIADLEEQTSASERNAVAAAEAEGRARLARAETEEDKQLFERQLEVVERRRQGMDKAVRLLDRLRVRRETAEHELKQLRLDLSRGAAHEVPMPELSSRLQFIRHEVAAAEEIVRAGGERQRSS